jgi:crotonobetainyl-CoA:carnitine CoA-transferase CaiB-like acyl-CoA transferase
MSDSSNIAPLSGVVVVERATSVAASYAGRVLALMGATVIKVEVPGGDPLRREGDSLHADCGVGSLFAYLNVNKSSVTLNLGLPEGRAALGQLIGRASVFIDDAVPSERVRFGITPDAVARRCPDLIYVSVLPFGAIGEHSEYRGYELNLFHSGGEGYLMPNGLALEMFPDRPPVKIYGHFAEFNGGTSAVCATFAALMVQPEIGGQFVDVSVQDVNVAISCFAIQQLGEGTLENRHERSFKYGGVLECRDGYVQVLTLEQHQWEGLVKLMGEPDWALDPELKDPLNRGRRGKHINMHLRAWAKMQLVEDVVKRGQALGVPLAKYAEPSEILESEQTRVRKMFHKVPAPGLGDIPVLVAPYQFMLPEKLALCAVQPGADNARVFGEWLGHSAPDIQRWTGADVL